MNKKNYDLKKLQPAIRGGLQLGVGQKNCA
jgi:hypothetical protein